DCNNVDEGLDHDHLMMTFDTDYDPKGQTLMQEFVKEETKNGELVAFELAKLCQANDVGNAIKPPLKLFVTHVHLSGFKYI
ncbi:14059_t:CDS:2, partial [Funneliformis geosporum]